MRTYIVTRHPGAIEWIRRRLGDVDAAVLHHVGDFSFGPGDRVCGVLPLSLAAQICAVGAQAHVLTYEVPESLRGHELSVTTLEALGARLVRYEVREIGPDEREADCIPG
jgi:CRISPR-associated protein Csx16